MKREELKSHVIEQMNFGGTGRKAIFGFYYKSQADSVMDALEARIKELEANQPKWIYRMGYDDRKIVDQDDLRTTKRALWLARAEKNRLWAIMVDKNPADKVVCFFNRKKRTAMEWYTMLKDNERKCREKAEEYK